MTVTAMISTAKTWLNAHSISSKTVASIWFAGTFLYNTNPDFKAYCQTLYGMIPHGFHSFFVGFIIPVAIFWRTTHTTSVTAIVEDGTGQKGSAMAVTTATNDKVVASDTASSAEKLR